MARKVTFLSMSCSEDILQLNLWWQSEYQKLYVGITMDKGFVLYSKGLRQFHDIWDPGRNEFIEWKKRISKFSLQMFITTFG